MNILISTTTNWNPGDDFIRYGVKNLLNSLYSDINYIHYDRNPDYFESGVWEMGSGHKSNIMNNPIDWSIIDAVVLAGSPEFLGGPLKPLYEGLYEHPEIPLLALGVGYSHEVNNLVLSIYEQRVLRRNNTLIITRQYDLKDKLTELLGKETHCLPCPALFAHPYKWSSNGKTLYIPQSSEGPQALNDDLPEGFLESEELIVHYIQDLKDFPQAFFSSEAKDLLNRIVKYEKVISNRLHGGIVAIGAGQSVKIFNSSNRVQKALEPYSKYTEDGWYRMTQEQKNSIRTEYIDLIKRYL